MEVTEMQNTDDGFAFIIAVNNEIYFDECVYYINRLTVPKDCFIDIIAIRGAASMCAAYNIGMKKSGAKYKIYLHQDVFIRNRNFLNDLLNIFQKNAMIGMVGMLGGNGMPENGVIYQAWDIGFVDFRDADMAYELCGRPEVQQNTIVEAVDGLLIATQYDIPWREDLFHKFDFYDVSQSFEMRKQGYEIVVPYQKNPWVIHDSSFAKLANYDSERKICLQEYAQYLYAKDGFEFTYNEEWDKLCRELASYIKNMMGLQKWDTVNELICGYRKSGRKDSDLEMLGLMSDICNAELTKNGEISFFANCSTYHQMYEKYIKMRFLMRRIELGMPDSEYQEVYRMIEKEKIIPEVFLVFILHAIIDKRKVCLKLEEMYKTFSYNAEADFMHRVYDKLKKISVSRTYTKKVQNINSYLKNTDEE